MVLMLDVAPDFIEIEFLGSERNSARRLMTALLALLFSGGGVTYNLSMLSCQPPTLVTLAEAVTLILKLIPKKVLLITLLY